MTAMLEPPLLQKYWVNIYSGVQPYFCRKNASWAEAEDTRLRTTYNHPVYRLHVKLKDGTGWPI